MKMRKMRIYIKNAYFAYPYKKGDHHFYNPSP